MNGQNPTAMEGKSKKSWIWWLVLVIIIAALAILMFWQGPSVQAPEIGTGDTTSAIDAQLSGIDVGNLENELQSIDADLNQL